MHSICHQKTTQALFGQMIWQLTGDDTQLYFKTQKLSGAY